MQSEKGKTQHTCRNDDLIKQSQISGHTLNWLKTTSAGSDRLVVAMIHPVNAALFVKWLYHTLSNQGADFPANRFKFQVKHGTHVLARKNHGNVVVAWASHLHDQIGHTLARGAKVHVGQPVVSVFKGTLPLVHQL